MLSTVASRGAMNGKSIGITLRIYDDLYRESIKLVWLTCIAPSDGLGKAIFPSILGPNMPLRRSVSMADSVLKLSSCCSIELKVFFEFLLSSFSKLIASLSASLEVGATSSIECLYWSLKSINCLRERSSRTNRVKFLLTRKKLRMSSLASKRSLIFFLSLWLRSFLYRYLQSKRLFQKGSWKQVIRLKLCEMQLRSQACKPCALWALWRTFMDCAFKFPRLDDRLTGISATIDL